MLAYLIFSLHFGLRQHTWGDGGRQMTENIWLRDKFDLKIKKTSKVTSSKKSFSTGRSSWLLCVWLLCVLSWNCLKKWSTVIWVWYFHGAAVCCNGILSSESCSSTSNTMFSSWFCPVWYKNIIHEYEHFCYLMKDIFTSTGSRGTWGGGGGGAHSDRLTSNILFVSAGKIQTGIKWVINNLISIPQLFFQLQEVVLCIYSKDWGANHLATAIDEGKKKHKGNTPVFFITHRMLVIYFILPLIKMVMQRKTNVQNISSKWQRTKYIYKELNIREQKQKLYPPKQQQQKTNNNTQNKTKQPKIKSQLEWDRQIYTQTTKTKKIKTITDFHALSCIWHKCVISFADGAIHVLKIYSTRAQVNTSNA